MKQDDEVLTLVRRAISGRERVRVLVTGATIFINHLVLGLVERGLEVHNLERYVIAHNVLQQRGKVKTAFGTSISISGLVHSIMYLGKR